jgi:hypothetical protein
MGELAGMIDARCPCRRCERRTQNLYRMVSGRCSNCGAGPYLMLFRSGDPATARGCPACGSTYSTVSPIRLATADEIPVGVDGHGTR